MTSPHTKLLAWDRERDDTALAAWRAHAATAHPHLDLTAPRFGGTRVPSDAAAIRGAIKVATACRCPEHERRAATSRAHLDEINRALEARGSEALDLAIEVGNEIVELHERRNPLRAMREAAGLSQAAMAARMGMSRGAYANLEKAARVTPAMLARAGKGGTR